MEIIKRIIVTDKDGEEYVFDDASVKAFTIIFKEGGRSYTAKLETDNIQKIVLDRESEEEE